MGSSGASDDGVIIFTLTIIVPERPNWLIALSKSYSFEMGKNREKIVDATQRWASSAVNCYSFETGELTNKFSGEPSRSSVLLVLIIRLNSPKVSFLPSIASIWS